jgi:hypothetical protein
LCSGQEAFIGNFTKIFSCFKKYQIDISHTLYSQHVLCLAPLVAMQTAVSRAWVYKMLTILAFQVCSASAKMDSTAIYHCL